MSESERSGADPDQAWKDHLFLAAQSFLKCAVAIDDLPFGKTGGGGARGGATQEKNAETGEPRDYTGIDGPLPSVPKTAVANSAGTEPQGSDAQGDPKRNKGTHELDLKVLTDSFAQEGIICGTLIPDVVHDPGGNLVTRARKMAQTADILIIDWYLKSRDPEPTLGIIRSVLEADKNEGGRTRLICIYTGEDRLEGIRSQVQDRLGKEHKLKPNPNDESVKLENGSTLIVFIKKKNVGGLTMSDERHSASEEELPKKLIREFAFIIDGLLPSFAASSIGAIRRKTHAILDIFRAELDAAYVGNRAISNPSEGVAELIREVLVSEFDNQIGYARTADLYLSNEAISRWLGTPGRVRKDCNVTLTPNEQGPGVAREIDVELILRGACGDIRSFDKPFEIDKKNFKEIKEKHRPGFTRALCATDDSAKEIEESFARLASNKREAFGRGTAGNSWRPSLTMGTLLVTREQDEALFYMCITGACNMVRISQDRKEVVLLCLKKADTQFNLVVRDSETSNVSLRVPTEFSDMKTVEFNVDGSTQRIMGTPLPSRAGQQFLFETTHGGIQYEYLGQLRYLRALRDVSDIVRKSTAIGVADSEWLRLSGRN